MTFEALMKIFKTAARKNMAYFEYNHEAGVRAVVEALRDEIDKNGSATWTLHQILASDGAEKAAGGEDSPKDRSPAADVCEWEYVGKQINSPYRKSYATRHGLMALDAHASQDFCGICEKPIKFKETR
jgi:hypothetical protein